MVDRVRIQLAVARVLRAAREDRGLSQEALADSANVHRNFVATLERGNGRNPGLATVFALAEGLGLTASQFVRRVETETGTSEFQVPASGSPSPVEEPPSSAPA